MDTIIETLFQFRTNTHKRHLLTRSFSAHMAFGELYDSLNDSVDRVAEIWMATNPDLKLDQNATSNLPRYNSDLDFIEGFQKFIHSVVSNLGANVSSNLANEFDEICSAVDQAAYKLKRFA